MLDYRRLILFFLNLTFLLKIVILVAIHGALEESDKLTRHCYSH